MRKFITLLFTTIICLSVQAQVKESDFEGVWKGPKGMGVLEIKDGKAGPLTKTTYGISDKEPEWKLKNLKGDEIEVVITDKDGRDSVVGIIKKTSRGMDFHVRDSEGKIQVVRYRKAGKKRIEKTRTNLTKIKEIVLGGWTLKSIKIYDSNTKKLLQESKGSELPGTWEDEFENEDGEVTKIRMHLMTKVKFCEKEGVVYQDSGFKGIFSINPVACDISIQNCEDPEVLLRRFKVDFKKSNESTLVLKNKYEAAGEKRHDVYTFTRTKKSEVGETCTKPAIAKEDAKRSSKSNSQRIYLGGRNAQFVSPR